jgi:hypothetical protein
VPLNASFSTQIGFGDAAEGLEENRFYWLSPRLENSFKIYERPY